MLERNQENALESLENDLYSRVPKSQPLKTSSGLHKENMEAPHEWIHKEGEEEFKEHPRRGGRISRKIMLFSLIFLFLALAFGFFVYYRGANVFSSNNIEITVLGPVGIGGGEELSLQVDVKNNNNTALNDVTMKIEYPEGTRKTEDISLPLLREQQALGPMEPGESIQKEVSAVLFGEENSKKEIKISVEYRVDNSNAIYEKIKKFEIALISAPVSITINSLKEINSGQDIEFTLDLASNSPSLIKNLALKADYPFGFIFKSATPKPSFDNTVWAIGDLSPGEKRTIKIRGEVQGEEGEERVFRFSAGLQSEKDEKILEPVFLSGTQSISIKKPFIGIDLLLDGESLPVYIAPLGKSIRGDIIWENNLASEISDLQIQVKIKGNIDKTSVNPTQGFYRSSEDTILWNSSTMSDLRSLSPGETGRVSFSFSSLLPNGGNNQAFKNPEITLVVDVKAKRDGESEVPEEILATASSKVRLQSDLSLSQGLFYYDGPFRNTGPIPPKADQETTYTVTWTMANTFNDVRDVAVTASLPPYVKWRGVVSPANEKITYNPSGGTITWNVGEVRAGEGSVYSGREVSFQISFLPSITQVNTVPILVNAPTFSGVDRFTNTEIKQTQNPLTSDFRDDSKYRIGNGVVGK